MKKEEIQKKLLELNRFGSIMKVIDDDGILFKTIVDSYIVLKVEDDVFWLLWKPIGYAGGGHNAHTVKIVEYDIEESIDNKHDGEQWVFITFTDQHNRKMQIEPIAPDFDKEAAEAWRKWQKYRHSNVEMFTDMDRRIMEEHIME